MSRTAENAPAESKEVVDQLLADMLDADKREKALFELVARKDNIPNIVSLTQSTTPACAQRRGRNGA